MPAVVVDGVDDDEPVDDACDAAAWGLYIGAYPELPEPKNAAMSSWLVSTDVWVAGATVDADDVVPAEPGTVTSWYAVPVVICGDVDVAAAAAGLDVVVVAGVVISASPG